MARSIINIETLEVYNSIRSVARELGVSDVAVWRAITESYFKKRKKVKGQMFEYLCDWLDWTAREKEFYTRKNNIYFM